MRETIKTIAEALKTAADKLDDAECEFSLRAQSVNHIELSLFVRNEQGETFEITVRKLD